MGFGDAILGSIKNALGLNENETATPGWQKRLKEAAYTGPEGQRIVFQYVDLKRKIEKRTRVFQFNGINGKYIQDNGHDDGEYPMVAFFTGDDQDRIATAFEGLLTETGRGKLEHPMYGTFDVVPTGSIDRENLMVSAANQTVIRVNFSSTLADVYPEFNAFPKNKITQTIEGWDVAAAAEFASTVDTQNPVAAAKMVNDVNKAITKASQTIRAASEGLAEAQLAYDNQARKLTQSLNTIVNAPQNLANQIIQLLKSPARTGLGFLQSLNGYTAFSASQTSGFSSVSGSNEVSLNNLLIICATNAAALSANEATFTNRPDALEAAQSIIALNAANSASLDELFVDTGYTDPGATYQANQQTVSEITGKLVSDSFELLNEKVIVLEKSRSLVDVCSELYGNVDDLTLQQFIDNNRIGGSEIFLLERGRRIVYYS